MQDTAKARPKAGHVPQTERRGVRKLIIQLLHFAYETHQHSYHESTL